MLGIVLPPVGEIDVHSRFPVGEMHLPAVLERHPALLTMIIILAGGLRGLGVAQHDDRALVGMQPDVPPLLTRLAGADDLT